MEKFDVPSLNKIRADVNAVLKDYADKSNITLLLGKMTYADTSFTVKLEGSIGAGKTISEVKRPDYLQGLVTYGLAYGMSVEDAGKTFSVKDKTYELVGLAPNRPKFPVVGKEVKTGTIVLFTEGVLDGFRSEEYKTNMRKAKEITT